MSATQPRAIELSSAWYAQSERQKTVWAGAAAVLLSLLFGALVITYETYTPVYLLIAVLAGAVIWRPRIGVYFAFFWTLLFEDGGPDKMMVPGEYFLKGLSATFPDSDSLIFSPLEVLLVVTTLSWLGRAAVRRSWRAIDLRGGTLLWPVAAFAAFLVMGLARGLAEGGAVNTAMWELRSLAYVTVLYVLAVNLIRTPGHVATLLALATLASVPLALEFIYRRLAIISPNLLGMPREFGYGHESAPILAGVLTLLAVQMTLGGPFLPRFIAMLYAPFLAVALLAAERRAGFIALGVSGLLIALIFLWTHRRGFVLLVIPAALLVALYLPLYWNSGSIWGQPARAVKSLIEPSMRDAASNEYRVKEAMNIRATIESDPLLGVGFGREFLFVVDVPSLSWWPFWRYEPHNNVMWVWLKTGMLGFIAFWYMMGGAISRATHAFKVLREPRLRASALFALASLVTGLTFSWVDLGLVSSRLTIFLGVLMGALGAIHSIEAASQPAKHATSEDHAHPITETVPA